jgi:hypothetical protein
VKLDFVPVLRNVKAIYETLTDPVTIEKGANLELHFLKGIGLGLWHTVEGVVELGKTIVTMTPPVQMYLWATQPEKQLAQWEARAYMMQHPIETLKAMGQSIYDEFDKRVIHGSEESRAEFAGEAVFNIASMFVGVGEVSMLAKASQGEKLAAQAARVEAKAEAAATRAVEKAVGEGAGKGGGVDSKIGVVSEGSGGQNLLSSIGKVDESPSTVKYLEDSIRNEPFEHGLFFDKDGNVISRLVSDGEQAKIDLSSYKQMAKNATFTHNHPNSSRFSIADLETTVHFDMAEIRTVTPNGVTFSLKRGTGGWNINPLDVEKIFKKTQRELSSDPMAQALYKEGNTEAVWDILYSKMAGKIGGEFNVFK